MSDWIKWKGRGVEDDYPFGYEEMLRVVVQVVLRDGRVLMDTAFNLSWSIEGDENDIIKYRIFSG